MTLEDLRCWTEEEFGVDEDYQRVVKSMVKTVLRREGTNWQALNKVYFAPASGTTISHTRRGYRKNTTGEYVSHAYRRNFGWKNTFYQSSDLRITLSVPAINRYLSGETDSPFSKTERTSR